MYRYISRVALAAPRTASPLALQLAPRRRCASVGATPAKIKFSLTTSAGVKKSVEAPVGMTLMEAIRDVAKEDMEAACDGTCACSTCHVIFEPESYKLLAGSPSEDEMDMLDLAPSVTKTSRLSCQVKLTPEMDGVALRIPDEMENQLR